VLSVAFRAAAQRGVPVTAVHAWSPDVGAGHEAVYGPSAASKEGARLVLDEALEVWRSRFADVPVETRLLAVDPAAALIRESEGAALTVVGSWSRGTVRTALFGSVSRDVAQQARCPVVVVPTGAAKQRQNAVHDRHRTGLISDPAGTGPVRQQRSPWQ